MTTDETSSADSRSEARKAQRVLLLEQRLGQLKGKVEQTERRLEQQRLLLGVIERELAEQAGT